MADPNANLTGITSAVSKKVTEARTKEGWGKGKIASPDPDSFFDGDMDGFPAPQSHRVYEGKQVEEIHEPVMEMEAEDDEFQDNPGVEATQESQEEETQEINESQETQETQESLSEQEIVEVDIDEYEHLKNLSVDELIAMAIKHRKGSKTFQSKAGKLQNYLGKEIHDAIVEGKADTSVKVLLDNLNDPAFSTHVSKFFDTHERVNGTWQRTGVGEVDIQTLETYAKLLQEKNTLDISQFIALDEFNFEEANVRPNSKSGQALGQMKAKQADIESKLNNIRNSAVASKSVDPQERTRQIEQVMHQFRSSHEDLIPEDNYGSFRKFIEENTKDPLTVYYTAWKNGANTSKAVKQLVLRELNTMKTNKAKSVQTPKQSLGNQKKTKQYDDYWGDVRIN